MITFIFGTVLYLALVLVVWTLASEDDIEKIDDVLYKSVYINLFIL